ncbi:MAG: 30S ribosomal protein S3 [Candidatus Andersenbacteria bacterium]|nr:30S ribosomal protein S3 [Candidatus Andersenbacteria bacterium]
MGKKINPKIIRITTVLRAWDSKWFAAKRGDYRGQLLQDLKIRRYFDKEFRMASISRIEIMHNQRELVLTVHTSRPAVVIGRGGSGIEKIQKDLRALLKMKQAQGKRGLMPIRINVQEVGNPDTDAAAVATQVMDQLERRMPYRRILKQSVMRSMQAGARGVRIMLAGRLNGAEIARREWLAEGNVPLHTFRSDVSYARKTANTSYGTIGIKVWINRGELKLADEKAEEQEVQKTAVAVPVKKPDVRRRPSLAEKVKPTPKHPSSKGNT